MPRLRRADRLDESRPDGWVVDEDLDARPSIEHLLGRAAAQGRQQARTVATADSYDDDDRDGGGHDPDPEELVGCEIPPGREEQDATQDGPDLARDTIGEGDDLGTPFAGNHAIDALHDAFERPRWVTCWVNRKAAAVGKVKPTSQTRNPPRYTTGRATAPTEMPNRAYSRLATTTETRNDAAVTPALRRPSAVATSAAESKVPAVTTLKGYVTDTARIDSRT